MAAAKSAKRDVLVAVDGSPNSETAFHWFLDNVYRENDHVYICHIPAAPHLPSFSFTAGFKVPAEEWQTLVQGQVEKTQKLYNHYQYELEQRKIRCTLVGEHCGNAGPGIIKAAESHNVDLLVIGTRNLDTVSRTFKGSVSDYVVHHAHCPVVIVPSRK